MKVYHGAEPHRSGGPHRRHPGFGARQDNTIESRSIRASRARKQRHDRQCEFAGGRAPRIACAAASGIGSAIAAGSAARHPAGDPYSQSGAAAGDRDRQSEGRRRQDHDRDQSRHRARRDRRARADHRSRSAGQCLDRARHRPPQSPLLDLRRADGRGDVARRRAGHRGPAPLDRALDARSLRPRARSQPGARPRLSAAQRAGAAAQRQRRPPPTSATC